MKLSYLILSFTLFMQATLVFAQDNQKVLYIHRNDGDFNVFFYSDIDSIVYSKIDADSILCDDFVTQEIWTADTVARIPISAIDSICFQTPSTVYKSGVVVLDDDKQGWIEKVDSLTLYLNLSTPATYIPSVGERLVTTDMNDLFPIGFIGRVKSVNNNNDFIVVDCEQINMSDVFDRYYCIVEGECVNTPEGTMRLMNRVDKTVSLPLLTFQKSVDVSFGWTDSEYCSLGTGAKVEYSCITRPTLHYVYVNEYGDQFLSIRFDFEHELSTSSSLYGQFSIGNEWNTASIDIPVEAVPFTKFYIKGGPRFEVSGNLALDFQRSDKFHSAYYFMKGTNSNVKYTNGFVTPTHIEGNHTVTMATGGVSVYGGMFLEVGYGLLIEDWGKVYGRFDAGLELSLDADIGKSIDNASISTELYDSCDDLMTLGLDFVYGGTCGIGMEIGSSQAGVSLSSMSKVNLFKLGLFPSFNNTKYMNDNDGNKYLYSEVGKNMLLPVPVGFKVFDDENNLMFCEYYDEKYSNFSFNEFRVPYSFTMVNKKYTAYPVFKLFDQYEILASPSVKLNNEIIPVTENTVVDGVDAVLNGKLEGTIEYLDDNCSVGFLYGLDANLKSFGSRLESIWNENGFFSHNLTELKEECTYYYCAYVCVNDVFYYGDVKSFATEKKSDEIVDLGLSVSWRTWNLGADIPEGYGNYYAWGETTPKECYSWDTYFDSPYGESNEWIGCSITSDIAGTEYDVATTTLGGTWRLPTKAEMQELIDECTWEWSEINGVRGFKITGPNSNHIFLPAAGNVDGESVSNAGSYGGYWTSTPNDDNSKAMAGNMYFYGSDSYQLHNNQWSNRYSGRSVRPVYPN